MSAPADRPGLALHDSEATLRQVESALDEFSGPDGRLSFEEMVTDLECTPAGLHDLVKLLIGTYTEIMAVIESLRQSRGLLEQAAMDRLKSTHEKLAEVSSATEMAAAGMLDGLDRALGLVDELDSDEPDGSPSPEGSVGGARRSETADTLRDELHQIMNLLQFQDITSQQLGYASGVLMDIEERMMRLVRVFDLQKVGMDEFRGVLEEQRPVEGSRAQDPETCDPDASTLGAEERQALADEVFTSS
jgi:chemotaxis regulatin CheY-phosphate phosphatase CheZ